MHLLALHVYLGQVSGAMLNFIGAFWKKYNGECEEPVAVYEDVYKANDSSLLAEMDKYFGGKKKKVEVIDMNDKLEKAGLRPHFHVDLWPSAAAVRELATQRKNKDGFVYSDLRKYAMSFYCFGVMIHSLWQVPADLL